MLSILEHVILTRLPCINLVCATLFGPHWNWGAILEVLLLTRCIFLSVNRMEKKQKARLITHAHSANQKNGNCFIAQYK